MHGFITAYQNTRENSIGVKPMAYSASQIRWTSVDGAKSFIERSTANGYNEMTGRPLSVVERRAFFEQLHAAAVSRALPLATFKVYF